MKFYRLLAVSALVATLAGCAITPGQGEEPTAGERPTDEQAEAAAKRFLAATLKDPDSVKQFRMTGGPVQTTWFRGLVHGGGHEAGWMICFEYNAKNSYGGYVGVSRERIVLRRQGDSVYQLPRVNWGMVTVSC